MAKALTGRTVQGFLVHNPYAGKDWTYMNHNRSKVEIHPTKGLSMDLVMDSWVRRCIGIAIILCGLAVFVLAMTPIIKVIRWW